MGAVFHVSAGGAGHARPYPDGTLLQRLGYVITAGSLPLGSWPYQIAYEWGALFTRRWSCTEAAERPMATASPRQPAAERRGPPAT